MACCTEFCCSEWVGFCALVRHAEAASVIWCAMPKLLSVSAEDVRTGEQMRGFI